MNAVLTRRRALIALASACFAGAASATDVSAADAAKARAVVQAQLDAFAADDAKRAFLLASPEIRKRFGTPDNFIARVRSGYPVVYRPATVAFLKPQLVDGHLVQAVQMTDAEGTAWLATYHLQRQPNGKLLIGGCEVESNEGRYT